MPVVSITLPDSGGDQLQKSLLREFDSLRKQLQGLKEKDSSSEVLRSMMKQQDALVKAFERLITRMGGKSSDSSDAILSAVKGMKSSLSGLGEDLKSAMVTAMKKQTGMKAPDVTVKPQVTVNLGGLGKKMDELKEAVVKNGRSRNRTFGSNY